MFVVHQDTRNTSLGRILQKIPYMLQCSAIFYPTDVFSSRLRLGQNTSFFAPKSVPQLLATQYTIFLSTLYNSNFFHFNNFFLFCFSFRNFCCEIHYYIKIGISFLFYLKYSFIEFFYNLRFNCQAKYKIFFFYHEIF